MKLPTRKSGSHKGQNGNVLIIGGNEVFHGAPILAALGAEKSGADLIFLILPKQHASSAKNTSLNFIIQTFEKDYFSKKDIDIVSISSYNPDVLLIGNGLGKQKETQNALLQLLIETDIPVVLDADALIPEILKIKRNSEWIITPHEGEFQRLFELEATKANIQEMAQEHNMSILKKGAMDIIADQSGNVVENDNGVSQMSVGGTGDALAGIVAGFWAQGFSSLEACESAAFLWGRCGEELTKTKYSFSARDMLEMFSEVAKKYSS